MKRDLASKTISLTVFVWFHGAGPDRIAIKITNLSARYDRLDAAKRSIFSGVTRLRSILLRSFDH